MARHQNPPDTYARRLDRWIAETQDMIAAHIAQHGPATFTAQERDRMLGEPDVSPQLDLVDVIRRENINEEIEGLERLMFAVRTLGLTDHRARIHDAAMRQDARWRAIIAPWLSDARNAIAPDISDPTSVQPSSGRLHGSFTRFLVISEPSTVEMTNLMA